MSTRSGAEDKFIPMYGFIPTIADSQSWPSDLEIKLLQPEHQSTVLLLLSRRQLLLSATFWDLFWEGVRGFANSFVAMDSCGAVYTSLSRPSIQW